jgi:hypothetical protein
VNHLEFVQLPRDISDSTLRGGMEEDTSPKHNNMIIRHDKRVAIILRRKRGKKEKEKEKEKETDQHKTMIVKIGCSQYFKEL